uniref:EB domain-containing protein n=1 Tax=Romanomermis culicivorax TaxID=13658 RepID=A0A915HKZ6_ROMCU
MCPEICYEYMSSPNDPCITCKCPKGYKRPLYYDLKECKYGKCVKSNETCIHNYCQCTHGFIRVPFLDEPECRPMPKLGDSCFVKGRKNEIIVLPCGITPNIDSECHLNSSMERGSCQCKTGYKNLNDKNKKCVPILNFEIGSSCEQNSDCSLAYSHCNLSRQCSCRNGYQFKNGSCAWPKKACPFEHGNTGQYWDVKRESCLLKSDPNNHMEVNNCTSSQFAFCFSDLTVLTPEGHFVGHCCPIPMNGEAAVKLTCQNSDLKADSQCSNPIGRIDEMNRNCPVNSHVCADQKYRYDPACCSRPCNVFKAVNVLGRCVLPVKLGESCLHNLQCPMHADCEALNKNYCQGFSYCPDVCTQKFNTYCIECECPDGYELTMKNYTLLPCKNDQGCLDGFRSRSIRATCKYGFCQCPKDSLSLPSGNECVKGN